ncbi:hypothetical protein ANN_24208, partial [Periplaneta americana]
MAGLCENGNEPLGFLKARANRDMSTHVCDLMTSTFIHSITPFRLIRQKLSRGWSTTLYRMHDIRL